jgi:protein-S-isoprenylcysteine O-methyltransferase Ste14
MLTNDELWFAGSIIDDAYIPLTGKIYQSSGLPSSILKKVFCLSSPRYNIVGNGEECFPFHAIDAGCDALHVRNNSVIVEMEKDNMKNKFRLVLRYVFSVSIMFCVLFIIPGNYKYWQGWVYFVTFILLALFTMVICPPGLSEERMSPGANVKKWDYIFIAIYTPLNFLIPFFCACDANRFYWSNSVPLSVSAIASLFVIASSGLTIWSVWTNQYFSSMVRIQKDRGQKVIQDGPYKIVRHPGYFGGVILYIFLPLLLNSWLGLIGSFILILAFFIRTYLEDLTLKRELDGYVEYSKKVRSRLIPFIW